MDIKYSKCNKCGKIAENWMVEKGWVRLTAGVGSTLALFVSDGTAYNVGGVPVAPCSRLAGPADFCSTACLVASLSDVVPPPVQAAKTAPSG